MWAEAMNSVAMIAGSISTTLFVASSLPMLYKAARTKELGSYSLGYLALANVGNGFHTVYVLSLPVGPIWALHSFYVRPQGTSSPQPDAETRPAPPSQAGWPVCDPLPTSQVDGHLQAAGSSHARKPREVALRRLLDQLLSSAVRT
jgi:hypothetical protein